MRGGGVFPAHAAACADGYEGTRVFWELVASFHECQHCSLWPQCMPRVVAGRDAVRKTHGTPRQRGGWHAHDHYMFCSRTPEMYEPHIHAFSPHVSKGEADQKNSQPVEF